MVMLALLGLIASPAHAMGPRPSDPAPKPSVTGPVAAKPGSPVTVKIEPSGPAVPSPGGVVELLVTVRSSVASDALRVKVTLTGGVELLSGEISVTAPIGAGGEYATTLTVRMPESAAGSVMVRASLKESGGGGRYSGSAQYNPFGLSGPAGKKDASAPEGEVRTDSRGRRVIEHRGQ